MIPMFGDNKSYEFVLYSDGYYSLLDIHNPANGCVFHKNWFLPEETYFYEFTDDVDKLFREEL
jgi:hypothetical protein